MFSTYKRKLIREDDELSKVRRMKEFPFFLSHVDSRKKKSETIHQGIFDKEYQFMIFEKK